MLARVKVRNILPVRINQTSSQRAQNVMTEKLSQNELLALTTEIVASHVSNNTVAVSDLPELIRQVYGSLTNLSPAPAPEQYGHWVTWSTSRNTRPGMARRISRGASWMPLRLFSRQASW
jgi:hypothetical protein